MKKIILSICLLSIASNSFALSKAYDNIVQAKSGRFGLDPLLVHALIEQESHHNPEICSQVNACGLMQLMPSTARGLGVSNVFDPNQNVDGGTRYLKSMIGMFGGNVVNALRAYNWGPGNMRAYVKGLKRTMPAETRNYTVKIEKYYYAYGGRGGHFKGQAGGQASNPNTTSTTASLDPTTMCKPVKLPSQTKVDYDTLPQLPSLPTPGGAGSTVFDPAKVSQYAMQIQEVSRQIAVLRGQYDSLTKGLAGLNLLTNVSQLAGFELPNTLPSGFDEPKVFGQGGTSVYKSLAEQRASDTGVFSNPELKASLNQNAKISNHAYAEAEMAWTQINCSMTTIKSLADTSTNTLKQSKDVGNRIALEKAMLEANAAKIRSSIVMMRGALMNYQVASTQAIKTYNR